MKPRWIYFVRPVGMGGPVKIGLSERTEARIRDLAEWSPFELEIVAQIEGDYQLEKNIHECFANSYLRREWFKATPRLNAMIDALQAGKAIEDALDLSLREGPLPTRKERSRGRPKGSIRRAGMTPREADCLRFIEQYRGSHDFGPSYEEIAEGLGVVSKSNVHRLVHSLSRLGRVTVGDGAQRSIELVRAA